MQRFLVLTLSVLALLQGLSCANARVVEEGDEEVYIAPGADHLPTRAQFRRIFKEWDENEDGKASLEEIKAFIVRVEGGQRLPNVQLKLKEWDTNQDGKVSLQELISNAPDDVSEASLERNKAYFPLADVDKDGLLDLMELAVVMYPFLQEDTLMLETAPKVRGLDQDGDGKLDLKEFHRLPQKYPILTPNYAKEFNAFDRNKDGFVDVKEYMYHDDGIQTLANEFEEDLFRHGDDVAKVITVDEFLAARKHIASTGLHMTLGLWVEYLPEVDSEEL